MRLIIQLVIEPTRLKNMFVKLDHETPGIRGENNQDIFETTT